MVKACRGCPLESQGITSASFCIARLTALIPCGPVGP